MVRRGILGDAQMLFQSDYGQYQVAWLAPLYGLDPPPVVESALLGVSAGRRLKHAFHHQDRRACDLQPLERHCEREVP